MFSVVLAEHLMVQQKSEMDCDIEQKYIFVEQQGDPILEWLHDFLIPDSEYYCGSVFSIYYDTPYMHLYDEKRNSDYLKSRVRLR